MHQLLVKWALIELQPATPIPDKDHTGPEHSTSSSTAPLNSGGAKQQTSYTGSWNTRTGNEHTAGLADNDSEATCSSTIV